MEEAKKKRGEDKNKEERVKIFLLNKIERKRADREISDLLKISGGSLIKILPVVQRRYSITVLKVLIERIQRNQWDKLSISDQISVLEAKKSLQEREQG